jgi:RNA polymerase sigma-70 factor (ECF subfamily)
MHRQLVEQARHGDADAFSALAADVLPRLYGVARLILREDDAASDAVQDALFRAWLDLPALRDPDRFDAWLHRLLVRACYRAARRTRSRRIAEIRLAPDHPTSVDMARATELNDQLERGFRHLSIDHRTALVLRHYLGLSLAEAAEALDVPLGTVQARVSRATDAMRAALEADQRLPAITAEASR